MLENKVETIFVSFGAGRTGWRKAAKRIAQEAKATGIFSKVISLDEAWLKSCDPSIYKIVKRFHAQKFYKGFGYMSWEPAVLYWARKTYPNATLLYMDSGFHIEKNPKLVSKFEEVLQKNSELGLAWRLPFHPEISWSKKELITKLSPPEKLLQSGQIQSGFIYIPNADKNVEFIERWRDLAMEKSGFYFSDELETIQNPEFIAHRHDQSSFSILWKLLGFGVQDDLTYPENLSNYPIVAMRNNTALSATSNNKVRDLARTVDIIKDKVLRRF